MIKNLLKLFLWKCSVSKQIHVYITNIRPIMIVLNIILVFINANICEILYRKDIGSLSEQYADIPISYQYLSDMGMLTGCLCIE